MLGLRTKELRLLTRNKNNKFEVYVLTHLDAAYNLARWMMGNEADARDVVQTAALRALTYIDKLRSDEAKAWYLGIVRNCCLNALNERANRNINVDFDSLVTDDGELEALGASTVIPEQILLNQESCAFVNQALATLSIYHREVLILREMEELSYEQIANMIDVPVGTVMSRLSRARQVFKETFMKITNGEST